MRKEISMFKNILIPTDGSELSQKAAAQGIALAKALDAKVTAFFAAPPATPVVYRNHLPVGLAQPREHDAMIKRTATKYLDFIERAAKKAGVKYESVHATSDYPEDDILKVAAKNKCDLIVMGSHGQGGLRGVFVGSVTQKVLAKSKIPVMVVH
jgi:nucleotide-binding universal stress UspA family protein